MASTAPSAAPDDTPITPGFGERVRERALHRRAGAPERAADDDGEQHPRDADLPDHRVDDVLRRRRPTSSPRWCAITRSTSPGDTSNAPMPVATTTATTRPTASAVMRIQGRTCGWSAATTSSRSASASIRAATPRRRWQLLDAGARARCDVRDPKLNSRPSSSADDPTVRAGGRLRDARDLHQPVDAADRFEAGRRDEDHVGRGLDERLARDRRERVLSRPIFGARRRCRRPP